MKKFYYSLLFTAALLLLQLGCTQYPAIQDPDTEMFNQTVYSTALRDSLLAGKLTEGMPWFVVDQLFEHWKTRSSIREIQIPVASLGSKQRLLEEEGWGRMYLEHNTNTFLDQYETSEGKLSVWYVRPDFYTMDVSDRDTLCIFSEDTVICSEIECMNDSKVLTIKDYLPQFPVGTILYAEVHYNNDHPWREISYWYKLKIRRDGKSFKIVPMSYELYPVEKLEFDNEPVTSFEWREVNKNEN